MSTDLLKLKNGNLQIPPSEDYIKFTTKGLWWQIERVPISGCSTPRRPLKWSQIEAFFRSIWPVRELWLLQSQRNSAPWIGRHPKKTTLPEQFFSDHNVNSNWCGQNLIGKLHLACTAKYEGLVSLTFKMDMLGFCRAGNCRCENRPFQWSYENYEFLSVPIYLDILLSLGIELDVDRILFIPVYSSQCRGKTKISGAGCNAPSESYLDLCRPWFFESHKSKVRNSIFRGSSV